MSTLFQSMQLAQHAYLYSDWHKGNTRFKFLIQIFILRTQGTLSLAIGPFGEMSNLAFISVRTSTEYIIKI